MTNWSVLIYTDCKFNFNKGNCMTFQLKSILLIASVMLVGCQEAAVTPVSNDNNVRGLKTLTINTPTNEVFRHYPSTLNASESSTLSFEISGKIGKNELTVGQQVKKNEVLLELNRTTLQLNVDQAAAALEQTQASLENTEANLERLIKLFKNNTVSQAAIDQAKTEVLVGKSQVKQLTKQLETAQEQLSKSSLVAPYDGIITSAKNNSYITVQAGDPIATIYNPDNFEARISVSYDVVEKLTVGNKVTIKLADNSSVVLDGYVSELASSTDIASSYPVVLHISEVAPNLKVGMAIEVSLSFELEGDDGFLIPLSAVIMERPVTKDKTKPVHDEAKVFLYDAKTETVSKVNIKVSGIKDNGIIVTSGLVKGDIVAIAGVPFLTQGQKVKLLKTAQ